METNRTLTATTEGSTREVSRSQASTRPRGIERHCVCIAHRATLARSTRRNGLRLWRDLLAPLTRLARSRRVGSIARAAALRVRAAGQIDLSRVVVDSSSVRAIGAGQKLI